MATGKKVKFRFNLGRLKIFFLQQHNILHNYFSISCKLMTDLLILFLTGMYLTDLTYIDTIHPNTGGLDDARTRKVQSNAKQVSMKNWKQY